MLRPGARTRPGRQRRGEVLRASVLLRKEDVATRPEIDLGPLLRYSVGFDRMLDSLRGAPQVELIGDDPPRDIRRTGEDACRVRLAGAGSRPDDPVVAT
jgi:hypothetical protein